MNLLHLAATGVRRNPVRASLTVLTVATAFLLFGLLDAVRLSFDEAGQRIDGAARLQVTSRMSLMQSLPRSLEPAIAGIEGVAAVGSGSLFPAVHQDARNPIPGYAVSSGYLALMPELDASAQARQAFATKRDGALVGESLMQRRGWKVGDRVPLQSSLHPRRDGSSAWEFEIVGAVRARDERDRGFLDEVFLVRWDFLDAETPYNHGRVGWYQVIVRDPLAAAAVARAIDALSANSDHETRTQTEEAAAAGWIRQLADIGALSSSIMAAVLFTLLLLTGHATMAALNERQAEFAVLKTLGFTDRTVLSLVLAESTGLLLAGGVLGIGLAALAVPHVAAASGAALNLAPPGMATWGLGVLLMLGCGLLAGALPALRAARIAPAVALARR